MASEAEVDLIISTADTLPELERDLQRIIRTAEDGAPELDVEAALAVGESLAAIAESLDDVVRSAEAGASDIELEAALDSQRSLSEIQGQLESIVQRASQGEQIELRAELDRVGSLTEVSNQVRSLVREVEQAAPEIEIDVRVDEDQSGRRSLEGLTRGFTGLLPTLGRTAGGIGAVGASLGTVAPLLASTAASLEAIAPASALAVSGMTALALVGGTVALAFNGVGEAIEGAFDPDAKPEDLAEALERLAPNARAFVQELQGMRSGLRDIQQSVQDRFFEGFDASLRSLADNVLPAVSKAVGDTAGILNTMARGAADAAAQLGKDGTLGRALDGTTAGLQNLQGLPGQFVTGLGQIAAAAAPAFQRVTDAAARAGGEIAGKLSAAFEEGRLEAAINKSVDTLAQLGSIIGNVFEGLGNIISGLTVEGNGLFTTLEKITQAFADVTASQGFQDALRAVTQTVSVLVSTVLPILTHALQLLGPVFEALAPPVQELIKVLGPALNEVVTALGPVLVSVASAFGKLVTAVSPLITLAAVLISSILPVLNPLFDALGQTFQALTPFIQQLADNLAAQLVPLFTTLATDVLPQLLPPLVQLSTAVFPVLTTIMAQLGPVIGQLAAALGQVLVAVTPLLTALLELTISIGEKLSPILKPLLGLILDVVELGLKILTSQITNVVVPAIQILVDLLQGDFSAAWEGAKNLVQNIANKIGEIITMMKDRAVSVLGDLIVRAQGKFNELVQAAVDKFQELNRRAEDITRRLPGIVLNALGNLGNLLVSAGSDLIQGLINGISGKLGRLREIAGQVASTISGTVGKLLEIGSPSKVMMDVGKDTMDGLLLGIQNRVPDLRSDLQDVAAMVPSFALPSGQTLRLPQFSPTLPTVQVYLGNHLIDGHVDARIARHQKARERTLVQGVRR